MTKGEAFKRAGMSAADRIERGASVAVSVIKGASKLPEGLVVAVDLLPSDVVEFNAMVTRWAEAKALDKKRLSLVTH